MTEESLKVRETLEGYYKVEEQYKTVWYQSDGQKGRKYGPAVEWANGDKEWWIDGKRHRIDGPAVERVDGYKEWYVDEKRHRLDGPAIEWANGDKAWYVDEKQLTEEEFNRLKKRGFVGM